ncbi:MAG TPA: hypothetical protein VIT45_17610 [Allosphingosinicella sp.]
MADQYTADDFRSALGETFDVDYEGQKVPLVLDDVRDLPPGIREQGCFRLAFRGPSEPLLSQGLYRFERGDDSRDIFIVPVAQDPRGSTYEAVFN